MVRKMKRRFVLSAMTSISIVVILLVLVINFSSYVQMTKRQDDTITEIEQMRKEQKTDIPNAPIENQDLFTYPDAPAEKNIPSVSPDAAMKPPFPRPLKTGGFSSEFQYMVRFFICYCDADGNLLETNQDNIASVSEEEAGLFVKDVLAEQSERGFCRSYRYHMSDDPDGKMIVFLNSEQQLSSAKTLLFITIITALCFLGAVFVLLSIVSSRAVNPYIRNIETQKRFITNASHELKTPLTSISTSADILSMEYENNEWIENIQKQSVRLSKMVSNLVMLSRLDEETPFPEKSCLSLSEAAWEASEYYASLASAGKKHFTRDIEENILINGDRAAVLQMLSALLENAVKYADPPGEIIFSVHRSRKKAEVTVCNTCLVKDLDTDRIFERFYRSGQYESQNHTGSGIGLSIARSVVSAHGGEIRADLLPEGILKITVLLPAVLKGNNSGSS